ncbi:DUF6229 family protein [Dyella nitratireducens]|uniref:Uncharacterized protein n=1 Tax=Dyella nitratireducens TaxID=1849580 RepID=A0ABQ1GW64_9GAMM|nr:hypothetical protein GCM10010981_46240 [Dyella nitratireducens]GLQ41684.1 hypothetical protein GCM10007902_15340 [Dyella nitratireducens]
MLNASQDQINQWRNQADANNPAGPLYVSGEFAESDITSQSNAITLNVVCNSGRCGTVCSGSQGHPCC